MHYYQFNIGDYSSHTKHLTPLEDICYRRLLDWYYLHEKPIPKDISIVTRMLMLNGCSTEVEQVLNEFFVSNKSGWINPRADKEIDAYHNKVLSSSRAGKISAEKRKTYNQQPLNTPSTDVEPNINHKPLTINHKPNKKTSCEIALVYTDNFDVFWNSYPTKVGRDKAIESWNKKKPPINEVLQALQWQKQSLQWKKGFIPNPSTYLNQGRWKDEAPVEELW